MTCLT